MYNISMEIVNIIPIFILKWKFGFEVHMGIFSTINNNIQAQTGASQTDGWMKTHIYITYTQCLHGPNNTAYLVWYL